MPTPLLIFTIIAGMLYVFCEAVERYSYFDKAPEKNESSCPHKDVVDVIVDSNVTCETIQTICMDCGKVLDERTEC